MLVGMAALFLAASPVYAATHVLVFGDSLSAAHGIARDDGWVALLRQRLAANDSGVTVTNASVSGETTAGGRARLPAALNKHDPDIVILELGGNDGLRALPIADMKANLAAMIEASRDAGAEVFLLGMRIPSNYGKGYTERFHLVYGQLAERYDVVAMDFFLAPVALKSRYFQSDGIHPNAEAQPLLLEHIWPELSSLVDTTNANRSPAAS